MKSKDLVGLSHTVKVGRNNSQKVTRHLNEIDKEEEQKRLQGADGPSQARHAEVVASTPATTVADAVHTRTAGLMSSTDSKQDRDNLVDIGGYADADEE
jgi:hypothetical protein